MKRAASSVSDSSYEDEDITSRDRVVTKPKKKRSRKHSSCDSCRARKVKCDRQSQCSNCRMHGIECSWSGAEPTTVSDSDMIKSLREEIARLHVLIHALAQQASASSSSAPVLPGLPASTSSSTTPTPYEVVSSASPIPTSSTPVPSSKPEPISSTSASTTASHPAQAAPIYFPSAAPQLLEPTPSPAPQQEQIIYSQSPSLAPPPVAPSLLAITTHSLPYGDLPTMDPLAPWQTIGSGTGLTPTGAPLDPYNWDVMPLIQDMHHYHQHPLQVSTPTNALTAFPFAMA
ncbi:hypothetical protein T439DRAFT_232692 [Meredithblackwellia eburnea MCA 4105]